MKVGINAVLVLGVCAAVAMGCTVGSGSGEVSGALYVANCAGYDGNPTDPVTFDLNPSFFAAEAVDDPSAGEKRNRLSIRLQRFGGNPENNDVLLIHIANSYEVARCVRGLTEITSSGEEKPDYDATVCYWPTRSGPPRMRVGPNDYIRASFAPNGSCRNKERHLVVVGTAVACAGQKRDKACSKEDSEPPEKWSSYIEFGIFGGVVAGSDSRGPISRGFKVEFEEEIQATGFRFTIVDDRQLSDEIAPTPPVARISGILVGSFGFDYKRGRAVQTFP